MVTAKKGFEKPVSSRRSKKGSDTPTDESFRPDPQLVASEQALSERALLQGLLLRIAKGLAGWRDLSWEWSDPDGDPESWTGLQRLAFLWAQAGWTENRLDQMETLKTPVWCPQCPGQTGGEKWMRYECLEHAKEYNTRSAVSWGRMVFKQ